MILIKYASKGRPSMFCTAMRNIAETIHTDNYLILVSCDEDDATMNNVMMRNFIADQRNAKIVYGKSDSKIHAINRDMEQAGEWDMLVNMSDDMRFVTKGWDVLMGHHIRAAWGENTDYFAHFNDGFTGNKLPSMSIIGHEYYDRDGHIYYPEYKSFSCDVEEMFKAMMRGRYKYFPEVYYKHLHPGNTPDVATDGMYKHNARFGGVDAELYFARLKKHFDIVNPVTIPYDSNGNMT